MPLIFIFFFFNAAPTPDIYTRPYTLSLHDALPISYTGLLDIGKPLAGETVVVAAASRSEEHTSELQSHGLISYAVFCSKKKTPEPGPPTRAHLVSAAKTTLDTRGE